MNKKTCIVILIIAVVLALIILYFQQNEKTKTSYNEITDSIKLTIKNDEIIDYSMTVVFTNESDIEYEYGLTYELEIQDENNWYVVKPKKDIYTTLMAYTIKPGESKEVAINLDGKYGKISKGHYRVIKLFSYKIDENNYKELPAAVEFDIK